MVWERRNEGTSESSFLNALICDTKVHDGTTISQRQKKNLQHKNINEKLREPNS